MSLCRAAKPLLILHKLWPLSTSRIELEIVVLEQDKFATEETPLMIHGNSENDRKQYVSTQGGSLVELLDVAANRGANRLPPFRDALPRLCEDVLHPLLFVINAAARFQTSSRKTEDLDQYSKDLCRKSTKMFAMLMRKTSTTAQQENQPQAEASENNSEGREGLDFQFGLEAPLDELADRIPRTKPSEEFMILRFGIEI